MDKSKSEALYNALIEIFFTDTIGSCHVETAVEYLERLPNRQIGPVLNLVRLISGSVSDLLAFCFMENAGEALRYISCKQMEHWVTDALAIYEAKGLQQAKDFLSNPAETTLRYSSRQVAMMVDAASDMKLLSAGLSGRDMRFEAAQVPHTDTETVFIPDSFTLFPDIRENQLFYRVAIAHKCAQVRYNSFLAPLPAVIETFPWLFEGVAPGASPPGIVMFIKALEARYPARDVARMYCLLDTVRIETRLLSDYKGLSRSFSVFKSALRGLAGEDMMRQPETGDPFLVRLAGWILNDYRMESFPRGFGMEEMLVRLRNRDASALDSAMALERYLRNHHGQEYENSAMSSILPYIGTMFPDRLHTVMLERRSLLERSFVEMLGAILADHGRFTGSRDDEEEKDMERADSVPRSSMEEDSALAMLTRASEHGEEVSPEFVENLVLHASQEVGEEVKEITREICQDLGGIPASYVSSALDLATGAYDSRLEQGPAVDETRVFSFFTYPEWDFRRGAYRKDWCTVKEMLCPRAKGNFVSLVLQRYRGQIASLRRQFELMRQDYRFVRRQSDGEEIDIDAFVEAHADIMAGLSPSEALYTRLVKDRRDIAVLFLVDMSASTEGWINQAIKESLVLLSKSLETLGDRYAIYGFSGMQRTGCQSFVIKEFGMEYDTSVEERITGISARDYTRMGPAIRHATTRLDQEEARLKILLTLSDGKPEDYDEYKGPYAIEDTRMALFEARQRGVRPFCITVDRQAREYLPRMYGAANYVLVPDVRLLHKRVPEIYRVLTT